MGLGVAVWSLATLLTPWAAQHSLAALLTTRVFMGLAEGVAMPCMNNMINKYLSSNPLSLLQLFWICSQACTQSSVGPVFFIQLKQIICETPVA
jgi:MFS family permease